MANKSWFRAFVKVNNELGLYIEYIPWSYTSGFRNSFFVGIAYKVKNANKYTTSSAFFDVIHRLESENAPKALVAFYSEWGYIIGEAEALEGDKALYWKLKADLFKLFDSLGDDYKITYEALGAATEDNYIKLLGKRGTAIGFLMAELEQLLKAD